MSQNKPWTKPAGASLLVACGLAAALAPEFLGAAPPIPALILDLTAPDSAKPSDEPMAWDMPRLPVTEALKNFADKTGAQLTADILSSDVTVGEHDQLN